MNWIFWVLGLALLIITTIGLLWTTLWIDRSGGPVSSRLSTRIWRPSLKILGPRRHNALSALGPLIVMAIAVSWVILVWAGWVFLFAADETSLWNARNKHYADWTDRIYFVAQSMFTMGNGDYTAKRDSWQIVASLTTASGMLLVTLVVTYILSVLSAAVQKRSFASQVLGFGKTPEEFLKNGWNGGDFGDFNLLLHSLASSLSQISEQYRIYPVLQYYHAASMEKSPPPAMAVLDEALTVLEFAVPEAKRPSVTSLQSARSAVQSSIQTLPSVSVSPANEPPPAPNLTRLGATGISTIGEAEFAKAPESHQERRKKLLGLVQIGGTQWSEITR